ncbi:MAG: hypothetical protein KJO01_03030 [Gammaproteobacteria bacterium]|nr:hypothetical protein [Gammaproteobacteria bacterium]
MNALYWIIPGGLEVGIATVAGFTAFLILEQFLHWHHCHRAEADCKKPLTCLILKSAPIATSSKA